jgi:hypothetical protein
MVEEEIEGSRLTLYFQSYQAFRWHREKRKLVRFGPGRPNAANKEVQKDNLISSF